MPSFYCRIVIVLFFTWLNVANINGQTLQKSINNQWANWWYKNGNTIQVAQNNQWIDMLRLEGDVIKRSKGGQWINEYYIQGNTIQAAVNGAWVSRYFVEGNTIKKLINGQWMQQWIVVNNNTIQAMVNGQWVNMYYSPDGFIDMRILPCVLDTDFSNAPPPPVAGSSNASAPPLGGGSNPPPPVSSNNPPPPVSNNGGANSVSWTKAKKEEYYNGCKSDLQILNSSIPASNQEAICLCYLEKMTNAQNPLALDNLISAELKLLQKRYYQECSAQLGININQQQAIAPAANTGFVDVQVDASPYRKSKKRGTIDYADKTVEGNGYSIGFNNTVAKSDYCKMAFKVVNNTSDFLLLNNKSITYTGSGGSSPAKKDKMHVIFPNKKKTYTLLFEQNFFLNDNFGVTIKELYRVPSNGQVVSTPKFELPATRNTINNGNFEIKMTKLVKETKETAAIFEVTYLGNAVGIVKPSELGVCYTKNRQIVYANDAKMNKPRVLENGQKCTIKAVFHISAKSGDMQFENMEILWRNTFQVSNKQHVPVATIELIAQ